MNILYFDCAERYEDIEPITRSPSPDLIDHRTSLGLNGVRTYHLCDTGAVRYQLSYQANWELFTM